MKIGARVLYVLEGRDRMIVAGTVARWNSTDCIIDFDDGVQRHLYSAFVYPDLPECRQHLQNGIDMRIQHAKDEDQFSIATYKLLNDLTRRSLR